MGLKDKLLALLSVFCVSAMLCGCFGGDSGEQRVDSESKVNDLISDLKADNIDVRREAADELGDIGDPRSADPLIEALKDSDGGVRKNAAIALGRIGDPKAVDSLSDTLLNDELPGVREDAAVALGNIGDPRAVDPLIKTLNDSSISYNAARALGNIGDLRAVDPLIKTLKDGSDWTRRASARALGKIGDGRAVGPLTESLNDEDEGVREAAADALGKLGVEVNAPFLTDLGGVTIEVPYELEPNDMSGGTALHLAKPGMAKPVVSIILQDTWGDDLDDYAVGMVGKDKKYTEVTTRDGHRMLFYTTDAGRDREGKMIYRYYAFIDYLTEKNVVVEIFGYSKTVLDGDVIAVFNEDVFKNICRSFAFVS